MAVVDLRESTGVWPSTLQQLTFHTIKNKTIIEDFQYRLVDFVHKKNDKVIVYFDDYRKKLYLDPEDRTDLNRFRGVIHFYSSKDKFVWKVKMK